MATKKELNAAEAVGAVAAMIVAPAPEAAPAAKKPGRFRNPARAAAIEDRFAGGDFRSDVDRARANARTKTQAARDAK